MTGDTPAPASAGLEARTRPFGDRLPLPNHDDSTVDGPPPPIAAVGSRTTSESNRVSSPDEPTAIMPGKGRPSTAQDGGATAADPSTAEQPNLPLLTAPFPGVLPTPRPRDGDRQDEVGEGARVGGHVLGKRLAQRPTCEVFAGQHAQHGDCVVQVLSTGMAATYAGRGFLLDARARTTIDDPRLVRVLGVGDAPRPWVAMERLRGPTLRQTLDQEGALPLAEAARIGRELARGLSRAHARKIVHGDLTPRDVRLEGEARAVKLGGFGVPKAIGPTGTRHAFAGGPALGEAAYAAPELFQGERAAPPSDVWAIGVILHEMLAGRPPFVGSAREVMDAVLRGAPPTLEAARPDVPPALATVVRRCLARAPADRFASAQELAAALHEAVPEPTVEVAPTGGRVWPVVVGVLLALIVIGVVVVVALGG